MSDSNWDVTDNYEPPQPATLRWVDLEPFKFFLKVRSVTAGKYEDYLISGNAKIRAKDATEKPPFEVGKVVEAAFFTKTAMRTRFKTLFGDDWEKDIVGKMLHIDFQGLVKSNQGRDMYSFFVNTVPESKQTTLPHEL